MDDDLDVQDYLRDSLDADEYPLWSGIVEKVATLETVVGVVDLKVSLALLS